jgi:tRNA (Thr-GGU) A37 N-methylase
MFFLNFNISSANVYSVIGLSFASGLLLGRLLSTGSSSSVNLSNKDDSSTLLDQVTNKNSITFHESSLTDKNSIPLNESSLTSITSMTDNTSISTKLMINKNDKESRPNSLAGPLHDHCRRAVAGERAGRTRAERALRDYLNGGSGIGASNSELADSISNRSGDIGGIEARNENDSELKIEKKQIQIQNVAPSLGQTEGYNSLPIGYIEAPFVARNGTPRQGMLAPDARANLVFLPAIPAIMLEGLESFSHVYVIFVFHENTNLHKVRAAELGLNKSNSRQFRKNDTKNDGGKKGEQDVMGEEDTNKTNNIDNNLEEEIDIKNESKDRPYNPWRRTVSTRHGARTLRGSGRKTIISADLSAANAALALAGPGGVGALDDALRARIYQARVEAPALRGGRVGVFGSRSPHRPNAIGLTLCKLEGVHAGGGKLAKDGRRMLVLSGCDLVNGTPVLDIKPYIPLDCPRCLGDLVRGNNDKNEIENNTKKNKVTHEIALNTKYVFKPSRELTQAQYALSNCDDFPPSAFERIVPEWVLFPLIAKRSNRLPVVWGPNTVEFVKTAVEMNNCHFYGPDAKKLCATSSSSSSSLSVLSHTTDRVNIDETQVRSQNSLTFTVKGEEEEEEESLLMIRAITQILALDIRSVRNGRGGEPVYQPFPLQRTDAEQMKKEEGKEDEDEEEKEKALEKVESSILVDSTLGQWMELYFDVLYIRFTIREKEGENKGGSYVQIEDVNFAKERKR